MLAFEQKAKEENFQWVLGIDEAGRGPLAGPVVAAAVCLPEIPLLSRIDDSKKLSEKQRETAFIEIFEKCFVGVGIISESVIDHVNILQATYLAMGNAVNQLINKIPLRFRSRENFDQTVCLLVDGNSFKAGLPYKFKAIVGGDGLSASIAAASIVAKVTRDRILHAYDKVFPQYGFKQHKGYPTAAHRSAIKEFGASIIHRRSFTY